MCWADYEYEKQASSEKLMKKQKIIHTNEKKINDKFVDIHEQYILHIYDAAKM